MKFRLAALRISSMDMKMTMMLRRVSTPATPIIKSRAPIVRNLDKSGCCAFSQATASRPCVTSWNNSAIAGVKKLNISIPGLRLRFGLNLRQLRIVCSLFLQYARIHIVDRRLLFERPRQHHGANDCDQQKHAGYFEW